MQLFYFPDKSASTNNQFAKITQCDIGTPKLWDSNTGRTATGDFKGKLKGIFPKLTFTIGMQNDIERSLVLKVLNSDFQTVRYWDTEYEAWVEKEFYFGDVTTQIQKALIRDDNPTDMWNNSKKASIQRKIKHKALTVDAVATTKRTTDDIVTGSWS